MVLDAVLLKRRLKSVNPSLKRFGLVYHSNSCICTKSDHILIGKEQQIQVFTVKLGQMLAKV